MRTFIKIGLTSLALTTSFYSATLSAHEISSSEDRVSQTYDFSDFEKISIGGVYQVDVTVGPDHSISLSGDAEKMERIDVYSKDGTLHLDTKKDKKKRTHKNHDEGITVEVTMPVLDALSIAGVASGDITGVDADVFELRVSGVAGVNIDGRCNDLEARVTGVGELNARDLKCKDADVALTGVGEMSVYASESVDVSASGVGQVNVYGNPEKVSKSKAFFAKVNIK